MSAAKFAAEYLHLDKLYLVPTGQPPHKALAETGKWHVVMACRDFLKASKAAKAAGTTFNMPVLYYTQFMGLALGLSSEELGLDKLCVSPAGLLQKIQNARAAAEAKAAEPAGK